ncbi:hypothetical protein [Geomicrobium sp. JCM 19039]|uniref:hypothetical protein n=1 Tax=Geomicrobium sp. JCM 19039 TaxID=1460636 RepID=UPI00045F1CB0|nr:hypothetical protein [Geomicrobium sp. JCM 19039]GAK12039.1 hypothetical protein JCM19039_1766 [Geomicrobium sp. JCM 19039]
MDTIIYFLIVLIIAAVPFLEYMTAIPVGIVFFSDISSTLTITAAIIGNWLTVFLLILLIDKIRARIKNREKPKPEVIEDTAEEIVDAEPGVEDAPEEVAVEEEQSNMFSKQSQRARKYWDRFGLPGLAIIGTGLLSSHLTAALACSFGANRAYLTLWMTISLILWSIVYGALIHFGVIAIFG